MLDNLNDQTDRTVVTDEFLRDISDYAERGINEKKLGIEAAEEAYVNFRNTLNQRFEKEGIPLLTDADIIERLKNKDLHDITINGIIFFYRSKKLDELRPFFNL